MKPYRNVGRDSQITGYDYGADFIDVQYANKMIYRYSHAKAGKVHVDEMKRLADRGDHLTGYINQHVHDKYDSKRRG